MASTYTARVGLEMPAPGEQPDSWGTTLNNNLTLIDNAIVWVKLASFQVNTQAMQQDLPIALPARFNAFRLVWQDLTANTSSTLCVQFGSLSASCVSLNNVDSVGQASSVYSATQSAVANVSPPAIGNAALSGFHEFRSTGSKTGAGLCYGVVPGLSLFSCRNASASVDNGTPFDTVALLFAPVNGTRPIITGGAVQLSGTFV